MKAIKSVFCTCYVMTGSFCHALTGTWRPAAPPRSLWGNSPVGPRAPGLGGGREPRSLASPCPHSEPQRGRERASERCVYEAKSISETWFAECVQIDHTLISPSKTNRDETKLYPWKEGVANAFLRRVSVEKQTNNFYAMEGKKSKSVLTNELVSLITCCCSKSRGDH